MEYIGIWSTNKNDVFDMGKSIPGNLKIEDKKITLTLNGSFENLTTFNSIKEYEQIFGFTNNGHLIILLKAYTKTNSFRVPGYDTQILGCETCIDFQNLEYTRHNIKKITFELNALNNYFPNETFSINPSVDGKDLTFNCISNDSKIEFTIDKNKFDLTRIWFANEQNKDNNLFVCKSKLIASLRNINISSENLKEFYYNTYLNHINIIRKYFMLLTNKYLAVKETKLYSEKQKIGQIYDIRDKYNLDDKISIQEQLTHSLTDTENSIKTFIKNYNKYKNIIGMFSEHIYEFKHENMLRTKSSFINICGILEDYYRNIKKTTRTEENDIFDKKLNSVKSKLDDESCLWLDDTLKFNNQVSFRCILNKFFEDMDILSNNMISNIISKKKQKSLITKIFNTRNWFTHYGNKTNILNDNSLIHIIDLLWIFLRYILLNDFKVNKEHLITNIKANSNIPYLINKIVNK